MEKLVTHQTNVGVMEKENSKESAITIISMVTKLMNARRNQNLKVIVTNARSLVTRHSNVDPNHSIPLKNLLKQYLDGTTISSANVIIVENMDTLV